MTIIQAKPQARIFPTKLSPNLLVAQSGQTIQAVIVSITDAAADNLYTVIVPPGHEGESYTQTDYITVTSLGRRESTFVVAASNSLHKHTADFICDGTDDQVQIQAAIEALNSYGGEIRLLEGLYSIGDPIVLKAKVGLIGSGFVSTVLQAVAGYEDHIVEWIPAETEFFAHVENLEILGNKHGSTGHGIYLSNTGGGIPSDFCARNVIITQCAEDGFHLLGPWGCKLTDCISETNEGCGIVVKYAGQVIIQGTFIAYNKGSWGARLDSKGTILTGSTIYQNEQHGIIVTREDCMINDNWISKNGMVSAGDGVWVDTGGHQATITGNRIEGDSTQRYGIHLTSNNSVVGDNNIDGNLTSDIHNTGNGNSINGIREEAAAGAFTLNVSGVTKLDSSEGAITGTLPDGDRIGQRKTIVMTDATASSTVSVTHHVDGDPRVGTFDAVDETWILEYTGTEWVTIYATCTFV